MVKETQINIANKGKLNIGGLEYAAGFSIEFDGNDHNRAAGSSTTVCTEQDIGTEPAGCTTGSVVNGSAVSFGKAHYENNYIDIINPSTKTTFTFSADHLKPSDVQLSDIVGGPARVDHVMNLSAATAAGVGIKSKYLDKIVFLKETSDDAFNKINDDELDFLFIDGCHTYECVYKDLVNYYPKVKSGGIISGDDFSNKFQGFGIIDAVNDVLPRIGYTEINLYKHSYKPTDYYSSFAFKKI
jgi:hypothetical protein